MEEAGWLKGDLVKAGDFDKIQELTKEAKRISKKHSIKTL